MESCPFMMNNNLDLLLGPNATQQVVDERGHVADSQRAVLVAIGTLRINGIGSAEQGINQSGYILDGDNVITVSISTYNGHNVKLAQFALIGLINEHVGVNTGCAIAQRTADEGHHIEVIDIPTARNGISKLILVGVTVTFQVIAHG